MMAMMRLCWYAALAAEAAQFWPPPENGPDGAYVDCPCARNTGNGSLDSVFPDRVQVERGEVLVSFQKASGLVPADYGSRRCNDWDARGYSFTACAEKENVRPPWCGDRWCFISPTSCKRQFQESVEFPGFFYSYTSCGNLDRFYSPANNLWSSTRHLYAYAFGAEAEPNPRTGSKFRDMFLNFAGLVLPRAGISLKENMRYRDQLSNATHLAFSSTYTGCVYDVALGNNDLCLGDIWMTDERQAFGTARFVQVSSEPMMLLTTVVHKQDTVAEILAKPFIPFDADLWLMVLTVICATGLVMVLFEFHQNESDFPEQSLCHALAKSMYLSLSSFVNAGTAYTSVTLSGRLLSVGYGLFILICIASFTANTASVLISKSLEIKAETIEAALDLKASICYSAGMQAMLEAKYPRMKSLGISLDEADGEDFAQAIAEGKCSYAIIGQLWMDSSWESGLHCDLALVGSAILTFPTGYYVSEELLPHVSWAVSHELTLGSWASLQSQYATKSTCPSPDDAASGSSGHQTLTARNMLGALLPFTMSLSLAIIVRCVECFCCGLSQQDKDLQNEVRADAKDMESAVESALSRHTLHAAERDVTRNDKPHHEERNDDLLESTL